MHYFFSMALMMVAQLPTVMWQPLDFLSINGRGNITGSVNAKEVIDHTNCLTAWYPYLTVATGSG